MPTRQANMTDNDGNIVTTLDFTDEAQVYREFIPRLDAIEYTILWRENGKKQRMDFLVSSEMVENAVGDLENFVHNKAYGLWENKEYALASGPNAIFNREYLIARDLDHDTEGVVNPYKLEEDNSTADSDPFTPENAAGLSLIVQMRMYDVLLGIYSEMNPDRAARLIERHQAGKVIGPYPNFVPE